MDKSGIFLDHSPEAFKSLALEVFHFQAENNTAYRDFLSYLNINHLKINYLNDIPFLPIQFFKTHKIVSAPQKPEAVFLSSGTTGMTQSRHFVTDLSIYRESFFNGFQYFYGNISDYHILALLPGYLERKGSSLVYMVNELISKSKSEHSGFYLNEFEKLNENLSVTEAGNKPSILIGVSYALLDFIERYPQQLKNTIIMETGGMKGQRKEMVKEELHQILKQGFGVEHIHSEYGMTELLSQAYSKGKGLFKTPPWMKILVRDTEDALTILACEKTGGINVIDLANINSCAFIATQDLGKVYPDNSFEIAGRFDNSDIRGCNLMVV